MTDTFLGVKLKHGNNDGVFIGGGQLGFNWQVSNFVLGFEWDIDGAANNNNTGIVFIPAVGTIQVTSNNRWITTLAARFGGSLSTHITPPHTGGCAGQATVKAICPTSADGLQPPELLLCCSAKNEATARVRHASQRCGGVAARGTRSSTQRTLQRHGGSSRLIII